MRTVTQVMSHSTVSVVVPTLNSARTVEACLRSVRAQTWTSVELIVVDNSSQDATVEIARSLADRVETWGPERSAQRNRGWRLSHGAIVAFIDSDMVLEPEVLAEAVDVFTDHADTGVLVIPELACGVGFLASCRALEKELYVGDANVEAGRLFRREALHAVGGYDEALVAGEDWDLADRVVAAGWRTGRVSSVVWHDEGRISLRRAFQKKRYYGRAMLPYMSAAARRRVPRPSLLRPDRLIEAPRQAAGLAVLKVVEAAGIGVGLAEQTLRG
ncbi:MAG: glycosyltransferase family 2 protein [Actinomycetes bacterium]